LRCPGESVHVGDHCYEFSEEKEEFDRAYEHCSRDGREFYYPEDCHAFTHMAHHLETMDEARTYWVGAEDVSGYDEWTWVNGDNIPGGSPYWAYDQPKHTIEDDPRNHCGVMGHDERYYLSEDERTKRHHYICKVSWNGPPGPPGPPAL